MKTQSWEKMKTQSWEKVDGIVSWLQNKMNKLRGWTYEKSGKHYNRVSMQKLLRDSKK